MHSSAGKSLGGICSNSTPSSYDFALLDNTRQNCVQLVALPTQPGNGKAKFPSIAAPRHKGK